MGQEFGLDRQAGEFPLSDRFAETGGIPVNDDGGEEVEAGHAVMLALAGAAEVEGHPVFRRHRAQQVQDAAGELRSVSILRIMPSMALT